MFEQPKNPQTPSSEQTRNKFRNRLLKLGGLVAAGLGLAELESGQAPKSIGGSEQKPSVREATAEPSPVPEAVKQVRLIDDGGQDAGQIVAAPLPPVDVSFPPSKLWSPSNLEEVRAYQNLKRLAAEKFSQPNLVVVKSGDLSTVQEGSISSFGLKQDEGFVSIRILPDGSYLLKSSGDFDDDLSVGVDDLDGALSKKLALSREYAKFSEGRIDRAALQSFIAQSKLPQRMPSLQAPSVDAVSE